MDTYFPAARFPISTLASVERKPACRQNKPQSVLCKHGYNRDRKVSCRQAKTAIRACANTIPIATGKSAAVRQKPRSGLVQARLQSRPGSHPPNGVTTRVYADAVTKASAKYAYNWQIFTSLPQTDESRQASGLLKKLFSAKQSQKIFQVSVIHEGQFKRFFLWGLRDPDLSAER